MRAALLVLVLAALPAAAAAQQQPAPGDRPFIPVTAPRALEAPVAERAPKVKPGAARAPSRARRALAGAVAGAGHSAALSRFDNKCSVSRSTPQAAVAGAVTGAIRGAATRRKPAARKDARYPDLPWIAEECRPRPTASLVDARP